MNTEHNQMVPAVTTTRPSGLGGHGASEEAWSGYVDFIDSPGEWGRAPERAQGMGNRLRTGWSSRAGWGLLCRHMNVDLHKLECPCWSGLGPTSQSLPQTRARFTLTCPHFYESKPT